MYIITLIRDLVWIPGLIRKLNGLAAALNYTW